MITQSDDFGFIFALQFQLFHESMQLIAQQDDLCHSYLYFCVDHPRYKEIQYSNVLVICALCRKSVFYRDYALFQIISVPFLHVQGDIVTYFYRFSYGGFPKFRRAGDVVKGMQHRKDAGQPCTDEWMQTGLKPLCCRPCCQLGAVGSKVSRNLIPTSQLSQFKCQGSIL